MDQKKKNGFSVEFCMLVGIAVFFLLQLFGCAAFRSTHSQYVIETRLHNVPFFAIPVGSEADKKAGRNQKPFYPDEMIIMVSDIQCRDEEECEKLDHAIDNINKISGAFPGVKVALLVAGDLTQDSENWQIQDYLEKESRIHADEKYKICGNHDVKKGIEKCFTAIHPYPLFYKKEIGNIVLIAISNWHKDAVGNRALQRYLPDEGLRFLEEEGLKSLRAGKLFFIVTHEKPAGIAILNDPRSFLFWQKYNLSNVYNSDELKKILSEFSKEECTKKGICAVYIYGHTHTPAHWPDTIVVNNNILFINTSAIRTTDYKRDIGKYRFGFFAKSLMKIFPWNKYSAARVLFLQYDSDIAYLAARNLTEDGWYDFVYEIQLSVPFRRE